MAEAARSSAGQCCCFLSWHSEGTAGGVWDFRLEGLAGTASGAVHRAVGAAHPAYRRGPSLGVSGLPCRHSTVISVCFSSCRMERLGRAGSPQHTIREASLRSCNAPESFWQRFVLDPSPEAPNCCTPYQSLEVRAAPPRDWRGASALHCILSTL